MIKLGVLAVTALFALPAFALPAVGNCATARDPARCEARQAALTSCATKRGAEKRACLEASMPPVDCRRSQNPQNCEAAQAAKEICRDRERQAREKCLRDETKVQQRKKRRSEAQAEPGSGPLRLR